MKTTTLALALFFLASGIAYAIQPSEQVAFAGDGVRRLNIVDLPENIRQEHQDRVNRLARLSKQFGAQAPAVQDDLQIDAGVIPDIHHAVPVIRVRYSEKTFFETDSAEVASEAKAILDVMAEAMKRDLPDTQLAILGHTDSRGTEAYNRDLAKRRAEAVLLELANRGVNVSQMTTVAVGEIQPVADNATEAGMAMNRRVEFMLSKDIRAIAMLVQKTPVVAAWLREAEPVPNAARAEAVPGARIAAELVPDSGRGEVVGTGGAGAAPAPTRAAETAQLKRSVIIVPGAETVAKAAGKPLAAESPQKRIIVELTEPITAELVPYKDGPPQSLWVR